MIYLDDTNEMVPLTENQLPLTLPELDDFTPTGTGEPPLTKAADWVCVSTISCAESSLYLCVMLRTSPPPERYSLVVACL